MRRLLLSLALPFLFLGCDASDPADPVTPPIEANAEILPLDIGNRWVVEETRTDVFSGSVTVAPDTFTVVGGTLIGDEVWYEVEGSWLVDGFHTYRSDGVWRWNDLDGDEAPYLVYKYPAEPGDTYTFVRDADAATTATVVATDVPITTPAGTFSAYHYRFEITSITTGPEDGPMTLPVEDGVYDQYLIPDQGFGLLTAFELGRAEGSAEVLRPVTDLEWALVDTNVGPASLD